MKSTSTEQPPRVRASVVVDPAVLRAAATSLRAWSPESATVDPTLMTEQAIGHPAVAAAVAEYVALREQLHADLTTHLAAVADVLGQVHDRSLTTEATVRTDLISSAGVGGGVAKRPA